MTLPTNAFFVAALSAQGDLRSKAEYRCDQLERLPGAAELIGTFSGALWRSPEAFELTPALASGGGRAQPSCLTFRWAASAPTAGIATLRCGDGLTSLSLLAAGIDAQADTLTLAAFQRHLLQELRDTRFEPAFALMDLEERPLVATIDFQPPADPADQVLAALADRCFAASFFRYHRLV